MSWLTGNWHELIGGSWADIALAFISILCGGLVGAERERKEKPGGFRTMTLVCFGSAAFTMASFAIGATRGDHARIASGVVAGVGFLGAGAILRHQDGVAGMTTSAT